jgi:hypothetical protein
VDLVMPLVEEHTTLPGRAGHNSIHGMQDDLAAIRRALATIRTYARGAQ